MRPVAAHEDALDADDLAQRRQVVLVEGRHPHVAPERLAGVLLVGERRLAERLLQLGQQVEGPVAAQLDRRHPDVGEPVEEPAGQHRRHRVVHRVVAEQRPKRALSERLHLGALAPVRQVAAVRAVAAVQGEGDAGLVHPRPERVIEGVGVATAARRRGDRADADEDHPGVAGEGGLQLAHGVVRVDERDVRGGEDAVPVVEAPVLVQPAVEGPEGGHERRRVVDQRLLHAHAERREEEGGLEALGVHDLQAGVAVAVGGVDRVQLAEQVGHSGGLGVAAPEVLVERPRLADRVERRVRDEPVDLAADQEALAPVDRRPLHGALGELGLDVAGEGVERLVVVVVGVERREIDGWHEPLPFRPRPLAGRPDGAYR